MSGEIEVSRGLPERASTGNLSLEGLPPYDFWENPSAEVLVKYEGTKQVVVSGNSEFDKGSLETVNGKAVKNIAGERPEHPPIILTVPLHSFGSDVAGGDCFDDIVGWFRANAGDFDSSGYYKSGFEESAYYRSRMFEMARKSGKVRLRLKPTRDVTANFIDDETRRDGADTFLDYNIFHAPAGLEGVHKSIGIELFAADDDTLKEFRELAKSFQRKYLGENVNGIRLKRYLMIDSPDKAELFDAVRRSSGSPDIIMVEGKFRIDAKVDFMYTLRSDAGGDATYKFLVFDPGFHIVKPVNRQHIEWRDAEIRRFRERGGVSKDDPAYYDVAIDFGMPVDVNAALRHYGRKIDLGRF